MSGYQGNIIIKNPATPTGPAENGSAPGVWTLSEALAFKRQGVWPTQGIIPGDPYFNYVSMLLSTTALGNANNNLFVDSSGAFSPISRLGNTTQGSMTPYSANWSNYFDGNSDNLTLPSSASYAIASSSTPFTIEAWIYPTAGGGCVFSEAFTGSGTIPIVISMSTGSSVDGLGGLYIGFGWFTGSAWVTAAIASSAVTANTWTHIACVFTGSTTKIYYNGVDVTKPSSPTPASSWGVTGVAGDSWYIGRRWDGAGSNWFSGYISNLRFVNGTAVYTANFTPPTAPLTAITNTVLLTCQGNRFRDASAGNATITVVGDTRVTDFSPFLSSTLSGITYDQNDITNWSGYFDGSGDYLSVPTSTSLAFGTGDFTIEFWTYRISGASSDNFIISSASNGGFFFGSKSNGWGYGSTGNFWSYNTGVIPALNTWQHVAISRSGTSIRIFVDGSQIGTTQTDSSDWSLATGGTTIGSQGASYYYNGYISNLRVLKGTALYTSNFTVPTAPLTAISGTSLLTLQNAAFTDNSTNNFVITQNGNVTVTGNSPFNTVGYWSNYFDGSGDFLSVPDNAALDFETGDFTVEMWVYFPSAVSSSNTFIAGWTTGEPVSGWTFGADGTNFYFGSAVSTIYSTFAVNTASRTPGTWHHVAAVRSSGNVTVYVNGVGGTPVSNTQNITTAATGLNIGRSPYSANPAPFTGYISNLRMVKGTAVYTSNFTPPTTPLTAITNTSLLTCQNGRFIDNSTNNFTVTANGDTKIQSFDPFYTSTIASNGGSMYFDGTGDYLTNPPSPNWVFSGDYTLEAWVYPFSTGFSHIFGTGGSGSNDQFGFSAGNGNATIYWAFNAVGNYLTQTATIPTNAWTHIVVSRSSGTLKAFVNGVQVFSGTMTTTVGQNATNYIGMRSDGYNLMNGYIAGLNITNGTARYTAAFTPPTAPANPIATTVLMGNGMNAGIYDAAAINDMETVGNAQVRFPTPFAPANYWAGSFDGSGDFLSVASNAAFDLGSSDFTVECWFNANSFAAGFGLISRYNYTSVGLGWLITIQNSTTVRFVRGNDIILDCTVSAMSTGTWYHVAAVRNGSTLTVYLNGTQVGQATGISNFSDAATALQIGRTNTITNDINGSISNARVVKGTAVYTSNFTPSTTPLTAIANTSLLTCQNKTFIDNSSNAFTITANGNATAGAIGPFTATGGSSVYFDGTGDYLTSNAASDLYAFGTGDFTVEMWFNSLSFANLQILYDSRPTSTDGVYVCIFVPAGGASVNLQVSGATQITGTAALSAGVWYHLALSRSSGSTRMFLNGTQIGSTYADTNAYLNSGTTRPFIGGSSYSAGTLTVNGYIDEVRVTKGYARYTSNFTPPTQPFVTY